MAFKLIKRFTRKPTIGKPELIRLSQSQIKLRNAGKWSQMYVVWTRKFIYLGRNYKMQAFLGYLFTALPCAGLSYLLCLTSKDWLKSQLDEYPTTKDSIGYIIEMYEECFTAIGLLEEDQIQAESTDRSDLSFKQKLENSKEEKSKSSEDHGENVRTAIVDKHLGDNPSVFSQVVISYIFYSCLEVPRDISWLLVTLALCKRKRLARLRR